MLLVVLGDLPKLVMKRGYQNAPSFLLNPRGIGQQVIDGPVEHVSWVFDTVEIIDHQVYGVGRFANTLHSPKTIRPSSNTR